MHVIFFSIASSIVLRNDVQATGINKAPVAKPDEISFVFKENDPIITQPTKKRKNALQEKIHSVTNNVENAAKKIKQTTAGIRDECNPINAETTGRTNTILDHRQAKHKSKFTVGTHEDIASTSKVTDPVVNHSVKTKKTIMQEKNEDYAGENQTSRLLGKCLFTL